MPIRPIRMLLHIWTVLHLSRWEDVTVLCDELLQVVPNDICALIYKVDILPFCFLEFFGRKEKTDSPHILLVLFGVTQSEATLRLGRLDVSMVCINTALTYLAAIETDTNERKRAKLSIGKHAALF